MGSTSSDRPPAGGHDSPTGAWRRARWIWPKAVPDGKRRCGCRWAAPRRLPIAGRYATRDRHYPRSRCMPDKSPVGGKGQAKGKPSSLIPGTTGDWEVVIGMEVHAQVASRAKLFSGASTEFGGEPNS